MSPEFIPKGPIDNDGASFQLIALRLIGAK